MAGNWPPPDEPGTTAVRVLMLVATSLAVLGLGALGFMFMMVRKAGKKPELPTAEELVGLPPALETKTDLIGEADESDTPLAGIELGEGEVRTQKLMEQVAELVKTNPEGAAKLIKRWVSVEQ